MTSDNEISVRGRQALRSYIPALASPLNEARRQDIDMTDAPDNPLPTNLESPRPSTPSLEEELVTSNTDTDVAQPEEKTDLDEEEYFETDDEESTFELSDLSKAILEESISLEQAVKEGISLGKLSLKNMSTDNLSLLGSETQAKSTESNIQQIDGSQETWNAPDSSPAFEASLRSEAVIKRALGQIYLSKARRIIMQNPDLKHPIKILPDHSRRTPQPYVHARVLQERVDPKSQLMSAMYNDPMFSARDLYDKFGRLGEFQFFDDAQESCQRKRSDAFSRPSIRRSESTLADQLSEGGVRVDSGCFADEM